MSTTPPNTEIQQLMGLFNQGRYADVIAVAETWTQRFPAYPFAWVAWGTALHRSGQSEAAIVPLQHATQLAPHDASAHNNLGNVLKSLRRFDDAEASYRRAAGANPGFAEAHYNLALCAMERGDLATAEACNRRAIALKPALAEAHNNLATVLDEQGRLAEAEASCRATIALRPEMAEAHNGLGNVLKNCGDHAGAATSYEQAIALRPDYLAAHSNLLLCLNYASLQTPLKRRERAERYGAQLEAIAGTPYLSWHGDLNAARLKIGFVGGEFNDHPVGYFLEGLISHLDPAQFELIAYPLHPRHDALTDRIKPKFSRWTPLYGHDDAAAARTIHDDGVHILIDLAGHTQHQRLPIFARHPAPVQATWLGYFATTGVRQMDWLLADGVAVPPEHHAHFTERIWTLPHTRLCFTAPMHAPTVAPPPFEKNGYITFGCYQNMAKLNDDVLATWSEILTALPNARLRLQSRPLGSVPDRKHLQQRLKQHGIDSARVTMHGESSRAAYLASHADVDMILDTFPFPGGTTTCEALWMGVPTLTLAGDSMLARQGASMMSAAGFHDWIASDRQSYIATAIALADDRKELAQLRATLRERMRQSPLFDAKQFAVDFGAALHGMWTQSISSPRASTSLS